MLLSEMNPEGCALPITGKGHELLDLYACYRPIIEARMAEFSRLWRRASEERLFRELVFCLFTPQSKARSCWAAVECLCDKNLLFGGCAEDIAREIRGSVRFHNHKARRVVQARELFTIDGRLAVRPRIEGFPDNGSARLWMAEAVEGLGLKEASHFLRNIGRGEGLAILDRHILRNLARYGVIDKVPSSLSRARYLAIEQAMAGFAAELGLPLAHLDMLLWCKETGEVFK